MNIEEGRFYEANDGSKYRIIYKTDESIQRAAIPTEFIGIEKDQRNTTAFDKSGKGNWYMSKLKLEKEISYEDWKM